MKTLYLHIGTPKTGTSTIQYFCRKNENFLLQHGLCYPDLGFRFPGIGQNRNAYFLSHKIYDPQKNRLPEEEAREREAGFKKLEKLFARQDRVVISDEHLWNEKEIDETRLQDIRERMAKAGVAVKAIVYLRRQEQVIQSYWAQQVKEGMQLSFSQYIQQEKYRYFQLDYQKRLQVFAHALGRENIIVRCYEKGQYQGTEKTILSDFLHIFDIALSEECKDSDALQNTSLRGIYLETKRLLNQNPAFCTKQNFSVKRLLALQESPMGNPLDRAANYFSKEEREQCALRYASGNQAVAREYLDRADGMLFYETVELNEAGNAFSLQDITDICGEIIAAQEQEIRELKKRLEKKTLRGKLKWIYHKIYSLFKNA